MESNKQKPFARLTSLALLTAVCVSSLAARTLTASSTTINEASGPSRRAAQRERPAKLPVDLQTLVSGNRGDGRRFFDVIVQFSSPLTSGHLETIKKRGGRIKHRFDSINSVLTSLPLARVEELAADAQVVFITPDRQTRANLDATNKLIGIDKLRTTMKGVYGNSYAAVDGKGIGVAVIDSGITNASNGAAKTDDFKIAGTQTSRIAHFKDFAGKKDGTIATGFYDDYGHGTAVAGVVLGSGYMSQQKDFNGVEWYPGNYGDFVGMAPAANLISLRTIRWDGTGTISNTIKAIDYAVSVKAKYNIRVMNISLGAPVLQSYQTDPLCLAAQRAVDAGIVVVVSAGNYGHNDVVVGYDVNNKPIYQTVYGGISSPGNSPHVITVGATKDPQMTILKWHQQADGVWVSDVVPNPNALRRSDLQVASFSSRGPTLVDGLVKPDLVAPGTKIVTASTRATAELTSNLIPGTVVVNTAEGGVNKAYCQLSGTSFAAPVVAGVATLMLQANPSLTPKQIKAILRLTAQQLPPAPGRQHEVMESLLTQGAGLVNGYAAVRIAQNMRADASKALAGQTLLKSGVTLHGLNEDLKLRLTDNAGNFLEKAIFNSGIMITDGIMMTDGIMVTDGIMMTDGIMITDGIMMTDGIMITDGSVWPEGLVVSDSYAKSNCLIASGAKTYASQNAVEKVVLSSNTETNTMAFYADGLLASNGYAHGGITFAPQAVWLWSNALFDPATAAAAMGSETTDILMGEDDAPIRGIQFLSDSASPYYPRKI